MNWVNIGSGNGLSLVRRQATSWTTAEAVPWLPYYCDRARECCRTVMLKNECNHKPIFAGCPCSESCVSPNYLWEFWQQMMLSEMKLIRSVMLLWVPANVPVKCCRKKPDIRAHRFQSPNKPFVLILSRQHRFIITMAGLWWVIWVCITHFCMVERTHLITTGGAPHLYNRGSSMQVNSLHSEANDM